MAFAVKLEQFEGPLDLLLELIEAEKLDISKLSLANVTDGYLGYLHGDHAIPPEELADFLVVATRLLFIKSRLLLPFLNLGEAEPEGDLESQLRIYKEYLDASKVIEAMIGKRRFLYVHEKMAEIYRAMLVRLEPLLKVPKAVIEKTVSIHEKITQIRGMIAKASDLSFRHVLLTAESKTEIIVSFLALLELVKQRSVAVTQDARWGDIMIKNLEHAA
jgi:segregation and condensation protein A